MITEMLAIAVIMMSITMTGFQIAYAQVLDRDLEAPTPGLNGTASTEPPAISIDISPLEPLPINGTVTISLEDVVDTNMNEIPPQGVTVIITNESVTVTNHDVTIEETETEPSQVTEPFSPAATAQSPLQSEEDSNDSGGDVNGDDNEDPEDGDDDDDDDDGVVVNDDDDDEGED